MVIFKRLALLLFVATTLANSVRSYIIPDDEIIWKAGTPIPEAVEQLKQRAVEVLQQNPDLPNPPVDTFSRFFNDMKLIGRTCKPALLDDQKEASWDADISTQNTKFCKRIAGESAQYPLTGLEWNAWYPREIARIRSDRNAYFRTVQETWAEAAWMPRNRRGSLARVHER